MSAEDRELARANGLIAPQYFNKDTDRYDILEGRDGAAFYVVKGTIVKDYVADNQDVIKNYSEPKFGISIVNDGESDVTFTVNGMTILVRPREAFDGLFEAFINVQVTATDNFRMVVTE